MKRIGMLVVLAALAPLAHAAEKGPAEAEVRSLAAALSFAEPFVVPKPEMLPKSILAV